MAQKPERIRTLGCGGLIRLAMELDKNDYEKEPKVIIDATDDSKDAKKGEVKISLAESTCRKLAAILLEFADKMAAARGETKSVDSKTAPEKAPTEEAKSEKEATP